MYTEDQLNEVITVLWNDLKGELIPEHEKLTKFGHAIAAWVENQQNSIDKDLEFKVVEKFIP
jgi:hypothetical protein